MKNVKTIIVSVVSVLMLLSGVSYAQPSGGTDTKQEKAWAEKKEARRQELYKDLNLSDEQKKALEENKSKGREQMKALFTDMRAKREAIRQELQKDTLDMAKIDQINGELKNLQAQLLDHRLEHILAVRKILTPEQFKKFISKMEEKSQEWKGKHKGL